MLMKMNRYILAAWLAVTLPFTACDYLDVEPTDAKVAQFFYQNPKEMQQALTGVYSGLHPLSYYYLIMAEVRSDNTWTLLSEEETTSYLAFNAFQKHMSHLSTLSKAWTDYYEIVARANRFISEARDVEFEADTEEFSVKKSMIAEARFLRAFAYFDLVRFWGRVPMVTQPIYNISDAMSLPQSSDTTIYEKVIIPDLKYAINYLDNVAYNYDGSEAAAGHATRPAAMALLGKVYWTMAGYPIYDKTKLPEAEKWLKRVIDYADFDKYWAKTGEEWKHIWISDNDNKYHIFEIQYMMHPGQGNPMIFNMLPKVGSSLCHITKMSGNRVYASKTLQRLYRSGEGDVRHKYTLRDGETYFDKFFENIIKRDTLGYPNIDDQIVDDDYFPINFPILRLEDVMLMYADVVGPTEWGVEVVNRIRVRAGIEQLTTEQMTDEVAFRKAVDNERRRELAGEGIRWHDIVRSGRWMEIMYEGYKQEGEDGLTACGNMTEGMYLYPIPDSQMKINEGTYIQNEAYR